MRTAEIAKTDKVIARWMAIPDQLRKVARGLSEARLDDRGDPGLMTIRETVHHLVEASLVASNIVIAALANSGSSYDWTWVNPNASWMRRLGYDKAPVGAAISMLGALTRHLAAILSVTPGGLRCTVQLNDAPGAPRYTKTVRQILGDEVSHAREHLEALPSAGPRQRRGRQEAARGAARSARRGHPGSRGQRPGRRARP